MIVNNYLFSFLFFSLIFYLLIYFCFFYYLYFYLIKNKKSATLKIDTDLNEKLINGKINFFY